MSFHPFVHVFIISPLFVVPPALETSPPNSQLQIPLIFQNSDKKSSPASEAFSINPGWS
jgi:hypothetical protein